MNDEYMNLNKNLNELFIKPLNKCLRELKSGKTKYYKYISILYYHFYHSTLTDDTILSPANLLIKHCLDNNLSLTDFSAINIEYTKTSSSIKIVNNNYELLNHNVVLDLKIFLDNCHPYIEHNENFILSNSFINIVAPKLSMYDAFYLQYLFEIAKVLNFITSLPSIFTSKSQLTDKYYNIDATSNEQLFSDIVNASIEIAINNLNFYLPIPYFDEEKFLDLFKNPLKTDDIFANIYKYYYDNFDIDDIIYNNFFYDDFSDTVEDKMDGFLKTLNYNFFTVFGYFLKFIRPIYVKEFDVSSAFSFIIYNTDENEYFDYTLFDIGYSYSFTELGEQYFNIKNKSLDNIITYKNTAFHLYNTILLEKNSNHLFKSNFYSNILSEFYYRKLPNEKVYTLNIVVEGSKKYWKHINVLGGNTLRELQFIICDEFSADLDATFSYFMDENESPFLEYSSQINKNVNKKSPDKIMLHSLNISDDQIFYLVLYNTSQICSNKVQKSNRLKFIISVINIIPVDNYFLYPCISKESKMFVYNNKE